jgi:hypothetical protein
MACRYKRVKDRGRMREKLKRRLDSYWQSVPAGPDGNRLKIVASEAKRIGRSIVFIDRLD